MKRLLWLALAVAALGKSTGYKVIDKIKVGGENVWDYATVDSDTHRLFVTHTNFTEVIDLAAGKPLTKIPDTPGAHGVVLAPELGRGFVDYSNGVLIFDIKTLAKVGMVDLTGKGPDALLYEPVSKRVITFNGTGHNASIIDARTGSLVATVPAGGRPEFGQADGKGKAYFNTNDTNELVEMDVPRAVITKRISLAPCDYPTGLAIDRRKRRLFSVCDNNLMAVVDPDAGKVIAMPTIGRGPDGVVFDNGYAFSANGVDGTITVVGETSPGKYDAIETVPTQVTARTIAVDPKTHTLYLPAADIASITKGKNGKDRRSYVPGTFLIVVVRK